MTHQRRRELRATPSKRDVTIAALLSALENAGQLKPSEFMKRGLDYFHANFTSDNNLHGAVLHALVERCLQQNGVVPFYTEVEMQFIPVARYDIVVFTKRLGPVNLSLKTTLRERWKQAEFEGMALRRVFRRSRVYVVNNSESETRTRKAKMSQCEAIRDFVVCTSENFDKLVEDLKRWVPRTAPVVPLVRRGKHVSDPIGNR